MRVASYNVEFGRSTTPEKVGEMFKKYNLDIIGFNEVPDGDWTARVGKVLRMKAGPWSMMGCLYIMLPWAVFLLTSIVSMFSSPSILIVLS